MTGIKCYCHTWLSTSGDPTEQELVIFRESAFAEAKQRAMALARAPSQSSRQLRLGIWDSLDFHNPACRTAEQCGHCRRLLVLGTTAATVQVLRIDYESRPTASTGRGASGFVAAWPQEAASTQSSGELGCYCGNTLDLAARPRPRGLVLYSELAGDHMLQSIADAIEAGSSHAALPSLLDLLLDPRNPMFRYAVQCDRCTRMLVLNDSNQVVSVYIEDPEDVPADTTGPGCEGFFDDSPCE